MDSGNFYGSEIRRGIFFPGEALPYMAYTVMCAEQGMVFKVSSDANNCLLNIYFHDFSVENY